MKKVIIEENKYLLNDTEYYGEGIKDLIAKLGKDKVNIIISGEPILIKRFNVNKNEIESFVKRYIENDLKATKDTLFHYEFKNELIIYSIKKGIMIEEISINSKGLQVNPIQFIILEYINKKNKKIKSYNALINIKNYVYLLEIINKNIVYTVVYVLNDFKDKVKEIKLSDNILICDSNLNGTVDKSDITDSKILYLDCGGLSEQIYRK